MSPDYRAPDLYGDKALLDRLGYGILDIAFQSGVGFEDVYRFAYLVQPERAPGFHSRVLLQLLGKAFERRLANAIWVEMLRHKWVLSEAAQHDVGIGIAAKDWYQKYGEEFERNWYLSKPDLPRRFPGREERGPGLAEKAVSLVIPSLQELLDVGFTVVDIARAGTRLLGETVGALVLRKVSPQERERFYVKLVAEMAGFDLNEEEAQRTWREILEHKWYMSEREGRDVGIQAAAVDYFKRLKLAKG